MSGAHPLPERLDISAATPLCEHLRAHEGEIRLDASGVEHLGMLCLQLLLATAADAGRTLHVEAPSHSFLEALTCAGLDPAAICGGAT